MQHVDINTTKGYLVKTVILNTIKLHSVVALILQLKCFSYSCKSLKTLQFKIRFILKAHMKPATKKQ